MADFTALKTAIQNAIKQNGNEEITGNLLQEVLLAIVTTLGEGNINSLITALNQEVTDRGNADTTLQGNINNAVSAINAINTAIGNGYVYAGIATPSTMPVTGKVFYLALTAGTYTNFGNTAVTQGINILKYNGSAWSLDAFVGIDDAPTPISQKLVKSGGVFDEVMRNGSAFDLSAYNGGATYADLNAALTALNALPAAYKRGGMSMKFVLSSDNKYVQARLMANTFTTDVTQWQGVDDEPTTPSGNLIKSSGVKKALVEIEKKIGKTELPITQNHACFNLSGGVGSYVDITNPLIVTNFLQYVLCRVESGDLVNIHGRGYVNERLWAFLDVNQEIISVADENNNEQDISRVAPENSYWLIINNNLQNAQFFLTPKNSLKSTKVDKTDFDSLSNEVESVLPIADFLEKIETLKFSEFVNSGSTKEFETTLPAGKYTLKMASMQHSQIRITMKAYANEIEQTIFNNILYKTDDELPFELTNEVQKITIFLEWYNARINLTLVEYNINQIGDMDDLEAPNDGTLVSAINGQQEQLYPEKELVLLAEQLNGGTVYNYNIPLDEGDYYIDMTSMAGVPVMLSLKGFAEGDEQGEFIFDREAYWTAGSKKNFTVSNNYVKIRIYINYTANLRIVKKEKKSLDERISVLEEGKSNTFVIIAASNSAEKDKRRAHFICDGQNDEDTIMEAMNSLTRNGTLYFADGKYIIDKFFEPTDGGSPYVILFGGSLQNCISIKGLSDYEPARQYGSQQVPKLNCCAILEISQSCYASLDANTQYSVIRCKGDQGNRVYGMYNINVANIGIYIPNNQKKIIGIDGYLASSMKLQQIKLSCIENQTTMTTAVEGCIGVRGMQGSNAGVGNWWRDIFCWGFYEGFAVGGEHLILQDCGTRYCNYGYTFGNYECAGGAFEHPITLINCCDEISNNLPLFAHSGNWNNRIDGDGLGGRQTVKMIDFNIEFDTSKVVGKATELQSGEWYGDIEYTIIANSDFGVNGRNSVILPFWANGSGINVRTKNLAQKQIGTTAERNTYAANYCQQFFDTTLQKMVYCKDPANNTWVDAMGTTV